MEESKAAAYYDELTRKDEGLGFTSNDNNDNNNANAPIKGSALPSSSSSFLSGFVKASTPNTTDSEIQHQSELHNIKNKLKKKPNSEQNQPRSRSRDRGSRHVNRSSSRDRYRDRDRDSDGERRSRSRSYSDEERERGKKREKEKQKQKFVASDSERREEIGEEWRWW